MASTLRTLSRLARKSFTARAILQRHETPRLYSTSKATTKLLKVVENEISLEQAVLEDLPKISSFQVTIENSMATLMRTFNQEEVKVQLDANSAIEVSPDEMDVRDEGEDYDSEDQSQEDEDETEPKSVPTFTVSVKNESGTTIQFDCSFDEVGPYNRDIDIEWDCMRIDSVSVVPDDVGQVEAIYSATSTSLTEELYSALFDFLKERGINEKFAKEILEFYKVFEHRCYVENLLGGVRRFCQGK